MDSQNSNSNASVSHTSQRGQDGLMADRTGETTYTYEYDSNGNWRLKKFKTRSLPHGQPRDSTEVRRTIEYF